MTHDFVPKPFKDDFRKGEDDKLAIQRILGATKVIESSRTDDINGIDYFAILPGGGKVAIDVKNLSGKFWEDPNKPELSLETWSIVEGTYEVFNPGSGWTKTPTKKKVGWTLDDSKQCHYILYKFDGCDDIFLIPFQLLRLVFKEHGKQWLKENPRKYTTQHTETPRGGHERGVKTTRWDSKCYFHDAEEVTYRVYEKFRASKKEVLKRPEPTAQAETQPDPNRVASRFEQIRAGLK